MHFGAICVQPQTLSTGGPAMLRISYQKVQGYGKTLWTGALRDDAGNVVWECGTFTSAATRTIHASTGTPERPANVLARSC
jgi:hypothetical protein